MIKKMIACLCTVVLVICIIKTSVSIVEADSNEGSTFVNSTEEVMAPTETAETVYKSNTFCYVSIEDWTYGETPPTPITESPNSEDPEITFEYSDRDSGYGPVSMGAPDTHVYYTEIPTDVGEYVIRVTFGETENYYQSTNTSLFEIKAADATGSVSLSDWTYGETAAEEELNCDMIDEYTVKYSYKKSNEDDTKYVEAKPTAIGTYIVKAEIEAKTNNYNPLTLTDSFTIKKGSGSGSVSLSDWTYGETAAEEELNCDMVDEYTVKYSYKKSNEDDTKYVEAKPTAPGTYIVQADIIAKTNNYNPLTLTDGFTIKKATGNGTLSLSDWTYGETAAEEELNCDIVDEYTVKYSYKKSNEEDTKYVEVKPTAPGTYIVKADIVAKTNNYNSLILTDNFTIEKAAGIATVELEDWTYGETQSSVSISSVTNGTENVLIEYKVNGANDSTYTTTKPTIAGKYVVRASFPEKENYHSISVTDEFTIMRSVILANGKDDEITYDGKKYDVSQMFTVLGNPANIHYTIDKETSTGDGTIDGSMLTITKTGRINISMRTDQTVNYQPLTVSAVLTVNSSKVIGDITLGGAELTNGKTYYNDSVLFNADINYLKLIRINGVEYSDNIVELKGTDVEKSYEIEILDSVGNTSIYTISLVAAWRKDGIIPARREVKLVTDTDYKLRGDNNWSISGDNTVYNGGNNVYVAVDGKYTVNVAE